MKCEICGKELATYSYSGFEGMHCHVCGKVLCGGCAKRLSNEESTWEPYTLCPEHYKQVRDYIESLKPKRDEPLTWRLEPHGSRPVNGTRMGSLFGCEVWYDPDMVQRAYNEWQESHVEPWQPAVKVGRIHNGYRLDAGVFTSHGGSSRSEGSITKEAANALCDFMKRERGANA